MLRLIVCCCGVAVRAGHAGDPQINSIVAVRRAARRRSDADVQRQRAWRRARRFCSTRPASRSRASKPTDDDSLKAVDRGRARLPAWHSRDSPALDDRRQQPADVHRRPSARSGGDRAEHQLRAGAGHSAERHRQRRRAGRRRRSFRRRAEERRPAERRARRAAAGQQRVLRSVRCRFAMPTASKLAKSDDAALVSQDCLCSLIAPQTASTSFSFARSRSAAAAAATYRMHIGTFPRPTAVFPPGGKPGEKLNVRWIGDLAGEFSSRKSRCPATAKPEAAIVARDGRSLAPSPNVLRVSDLPWSNEAGAERRSQDRRRRAGGASRWPCTASSSSRATSISSSSPPRRGSSSMCACLPASRSARRSMRCSTFTMPKGGTIGNNDDTGGPDSFVRVHDSGRRRLFRFGPRSAQGRRAGVRLSRRNHRNEAVARRSACRSSGDTFRRRSSCRRTIATR